MAAEFVADLIRLRTREGMNVARAKGHLRSSQPQQAYDVQADRPPSPTEPENLAPRLLINKEDSICSARGGWPSESGRRADEAICRCRGGPWSPGDGYPLPGGTGGAGERARSGPSWSSRVAWGTDIPAWVRPEPTDEHRPIAHHSTKRSSQLADLALGLANEGREDDKAVDELIATAGRHRRELRRAAAGIRFTGWRSCATRTSVRWFLVPAVQDYCDWCYRPIDTVDRQRSENAGTDQESAWACVDCIESGRVFEPPESWEGDPASWPVKDIRGQVKLAKENVELVLADVRRTTDIEPVVVVDAYRSVVRIAWWGCTTPSVRARSNPEALVETADYLKDQIVEEEGWSPSPVCPIHGIGGVQPKVRDGVAIWWCSFGDHLLADVGRLGL
jgi:hypothetical protein